MSQQPRPDFRRVEQLFHAALECEPARRDAFLSEACAGDQDLLAEVRSLLDEDQADSDELCAVERGALLEPLLAGELPRRLGPYRLLRVVGEGGMGLVYEAERADGTFEGRAAIKMLRPGPSTRGLLQRFLNERRTLARLEHPGIARLLDAGADENGWPWLALEFVRGERIDRWCDARRLGLRQRVELFARVVDAVAHAHEALVVHRDLKPDNILVNLAGEPRLLDFGIAKVLREATTEAALTHTGERALTPAYASPEQWRGESVGPRSDVYSLGLVLFELLCGGSPYRSAPENAAERSRELQQGTRRAASEALVGANADRAAELAAARGSTPKLLARALRGDLDRIVAVALHPEPERRYPSAAALAEDLRRHLAGRPVLARGDSSAYRLRCWARRHRLEAASLASLLAAALVFAIYFVRQSLHEKRQLAEIARLGDLAQVAELRQRSATLWPAVPACVPELERWLGEARALLARRAVHEASLERLRGASVASAEQARLREFLIPQHERLLSELDALCAADVHGDTVSGVEQRLERAQSLEARSWIEARAAWEQCATRLSREPRLAPVARLRPLGLVPLGPDPRGGLEAFLVLDSGAAPARRARAEAPGEEFALEAETGIVLLLVPGGAFELGAQSVDPAAANFDPLAESDEAPVASVVLAPYLLSKWELTQAQWQRLAGDNPSDRQGSPLQPVERVHWQRARHWLARYSLELPSEAQWEAAARAGTHTPWPTGAEEGSLQGFANLSDRFARANGGSSGWTTTEAVDDGHTVHAPAGSFAPNAWGFHDMLGNVWEWTLDLYGGYQRAARDGDGLRGDPDDFALAEREGIVARGGGYLNPAPMLRAAERYRASPTLESRSTGLRPARAWK